MNNSGTISWGARLPYLKEGDDLVSAVFKGVVDSYKENGLDIADCDIVAITESLVARTQGNYVSFDDISKEVEKKYGFEEIAFTFPITSRNRVAGQLAAVAAGVKKVYVQLSFPQDEVGNPLIDPLLMFEKNIDYNGVYSVKEFKELVGGPTIMPFTNVDYLELYENLAPNIEVFLANDPRAVLKYTKNILIASIYRRKMDRMILKESGADKIFDLSEILNEPSSEHGYNPNFGLYGSNKTGNKIKLYPYNAQNILKSIQDKISEYCGKHVEVMIYGDGAFKDPICGIWELYDPCISPYYSNGLEGSPNEVKLKDLIDSGYSDEEIAELIENNPNKQGALGTTPRRYTDLLGSLCDLMSGSGDRGTPVVVIKNYFNDKKKAEIMAGEHFIIETK